MRFAGAMDKGAALGTFRRLSAVRRDIRLLGPGDPFVEALWQFSEEDDRGRVFALWRTREYWGDRDDALTFCFDFRFRPDIAAALVGTSETARAATMAALRRRAETTSRR